MDHPTTNRDPGRLSRDLSQLRHLLDQLPYSLAIDASNRLLAQAEALAKRPAVSTGSANTPITAASGHEQCFSLRTAARYTRQSTAAISFAIRSGALKASRFGRNWRILPESLKQWIENRQD